MAISTVLTDKIRFPEGTNIEDTWINDAEVQVDEEAGTYTIIRHHGPQAGSTTRPVYMGEDGQPIPISHTINADVPSDAVFGIEGIIAKDVEPPRKLRWGESFTAVGDMEIDDNYHVTKLVLQKYTLPYPTVAVEESLTPEQEAATDIWIKVDSSTNPDTEETSVTTAYGETYDIISSIEVSPTTGKVLSITKGQIILPYASTLVASSVPLYNNDAVIWINPDDSSTERTTSMRAVNFYNNPYQSFIAKDGTKITKIDITASNGNTLSVTPDSMFGGGSDWSPDENGEWGQHYLTTQTEGYYFVYTVTENVLAIGYEPDSICRTLNITSNDTILQFEIYLELPA